MKSTPDYVQHRALSRVDPYRDHLLSRYSLGSHGYPQIGWQENGKTSMRLVHRVVWEAINGPIPEGMTVDHICKRKRCVNVKHLRLLSKSHNSAIGAGPDRPEGVCPRGHDPARYSRGASGHLYCRDCNNERNQRARREGRA